MVAGQPDAATKKKPPRHLGTVFIDVEVCKGCGFCIEFCPPRVLEFSTEFNAKGYHYPLLTDEQECTGCDLCALYCPDFAIFSIRFRNPEYEREKGKGGEE